jgi:tellurite resistance protein TerC
MEQSWNWWLGFNLFVLVMLAVDLGVFQRKAHEVRFREALLWSVVWILLALLFTLGIWRGWLADYAAADRGRVALEFLTGYVIEKSLSVDNLFVFAIIFTYFAVPKIYQHRVLFFGILGALIFRAIFIFGGLWLITKFTWVIYVFGAFLIFTGIKLALAKDKQIEPEKNPVMRLTRALLPVSTTYVGGRFLTRQAGRVVATPLLLVLIFVEFTDIVFAVDSIPAIIAITRDSFIVYTSNVFAILGLRALYFVLAAFLQLFHYLSYGLAALLVFIGCKMLADPLFHFKLPVGVSLGIVAVILAVAIAASLLWPPRKTSDVTSV